MLGEVEVAADDRRQRFVLQQVEQIRPLHAVLDDVVQATRR
jgi:hypothetical protein